MTLELFIARYGLLALGLGAGVEGETVVILGGVMVHRGTLPFVPAVAVAALGSCVADQLFFLLGRRFRNAGFVRRVQARPAFRRAFAAFERYPTLFVFAFRFLYGLRTVSPVAIGTTDLPGTRFLVINAVAALVWGSLFVSIGYLFGQTVEALFGRIHAAEHVLLPAAAGLGLLALALHLYRRARAG